MGNKMCDKCFFHGTSREKKKRRIQENTITPPKSAYELFMQKRMKEHNMTMWFTDEKCDECGKDIFTDGMIYFCQEGCVQHGKRGKNDCEGMGFISDLIR